MGSFNKVILMGNLTRDPELRYTPSGTPVCDFGMAMNRNYTTQGGEKKEDTCFVDVTVWSRRGEVINEYFSKGDSIFVEGRLQLDQWETPEGRRSKLKVIGNNFEFCGRTSGGSGGQSDQRSSRNREANQPGGGQSSNNQSGQSQNAAPQQNQGGGASGASQEPQDAGYDVSDDEIPF